MEFYSIIFYPLDALLGVVLRRLGLFGLNGGELEDLDPLVESDPPVEARRRVVAARRR